MNNPKRPLTNYNRKQGADIFTFSLPRNTCLAHKTPLCFERCYGRKKVFLTHDVLGRYIKNLADSKDPDFESYVIDQIIREKVDYIRIHTIGDFYSQAYFERWVTIARICPATKFLAYTRNWELDASNLPDNFKLYYSVDVTTTKFNPTIDRRSTMFFPPPEVKVYAHLEPFSRPEFEGRICSSRCSHCKTCWNGHFNIAFPIVTNLRVTYKSETMDYYSLPKRTQVKA